MRTLTIPEAAYHAGIMDGEGAIQIHSKMHTNKSGLAIRSYKLAISVTNTDMEMLIFLKQTTGRGRIIPSRKDHKTGKDAFIWYLAREDFETYLNQLLPYLITKKVRALLFLEFLTYHRSHSSIPITDEDDTMRSIICDELTEMNKRGK